MTGSSTSNATSRCTKHPDRPIHARGMCESCYRTWLLQTNPRAREAQRRHNRKCTNKRYATDPEFRRRRIYQGMGYSPKMAKELAKLNLLKRKGIHEFSGL